MVADWMLNLWKLENRRKIKLMPIPAFERGGRRTLSLGSTIISINKRSEHIEVCWEMAGALHLVEVAVSVSIKRIGMRHSITSPIPSAVVNPAARFLSSKHPTSRALRPRKTSFSGL